MAGILDLMGYVQQQGEAGRQRGQESRIARLYSQGLQAPSEQRPGIVAQIAQSSPDAANSAMASYGKMDDAARDDLAASAGQFAAIAQADPATAQQMYPQLAAKAHAVGIPVPAAYDPKFLPAIQKLASASGGTAEQQNFDTMTQGLSPEDQAKARRIHLGLDPRAGLPSVFDAGANGVYGIDRSSYSMQPIMPAGQAPQQPAMQQVQYATSDGTPIPPNEQAAAEAAMLAASRGEDVNIPVGGPIAPALDYQNGGQLHRAPKPAPEPTQLQLNADARDQERLRLAQEAAARAANPKMTPYQAAQMAIKDAATAAKQEKALASKADVVDSYDESISNIDKLLNSPGVKTLGTYMGDAMGMVPHTEAADARAALDTIKNRVLLDTISKLKALSATGASGFGSLSNQEGDILKNSIASLDRAQTQPAIVAALRQIRATMMKSKERIAGFSGPAPTQPADNNGWSAKRVN